jgi:hypothetical protein
MTSMPVSSKSDTLRVASAAHRERHTAAIRAPKPAIGFPSRSRPRAMTAQCGPCHFVAPGPVKVDSAQSGEPVEKRREQPGGIPGLTHGLRDNRAHLRFHRPAMTSGTKLKPPADDGTCW